MIHGVRRLLVVLAVGTALGATGCGGSRPARHATTSARVVDGTCQSAAAAEKPAAQSCTFVLGDGERFSCGQPFKGPAPTAPQLEHARCRRLSSLRLSAAERALIRRLGDARICLTEKGLRVSGGPVLLNQSGSNQPGGELVLSSDDPTFIAFYADAAQAARIEPALARADSSSHVQVERRGAETVIWSAAPTTQLRASVRACVD
jgi:hypothetical protein